VEVSAFVDTSAFIALVDRTDDRHTKAGSVYGDCLHRGDLLLTTDYIVAEALSVAQKRLGITAVRAIVNGYLPTMTMIWVTPDDHALGTEALLAAGRRSLSLVDCISFVVMRRLNLANAFAFDKHFVEQGFELLA
jgi:predicted nucleic acid-binding protein